MPTIKSEGNHIHTWQCVVTVIGDGVLGLI